MLTLRRLIPMLALTASACNGGGGPAAPTSPAAIPTAVVVVSGETGQPVAGAALTAGGRAVVTDGAGRARVEGAAGTPVAIEAGGFLLRETALDLGTPTFSLWPLRPDAGEGFLADLVYNYLVSDGALARPVAAVTLELGPELTRDAAARAAHERAAERLSAANGAIPFGLGTGGAVVFQAGVNPSDPILREHPEYVAVTRVTTQSHRVVSGSLTFRSLRDAQNPALVTHELGHAFGLGHTAQAGLMSPVVRPGLADFTAAERSAMRMMALRRPGNRQPDSDLGVAASSSASRAVGCEG